MKTKMNTVLSKFRLFALQYNYENKEILSIYIDIDTTRQKNRKEKPAWEIELKNQFKKVFKTINPELLKRYNTRQEWRQFREKLEQFLNNYLESYTGKSLLILSDLKDIFAIDLQVPVKTTVHYGMPRIEHLLYIMDKYKKYLVLIVAEAEIRVIEVFVGEISDEMWIETNREVKNRFGKKARTLASDRRDLYTEDRYAREIAEELNNYFMADPDIERLVLGGNQKIAHNIKNRLHPSIQKVLVGIERLDIKTNEADIAEEISELAAAYETQSNERLIEELKAQYNSNGLAIVELSAVNKALVSNRVKTLIISYPIEAKEKNELLYKAILNDIEIRFIYGKAMQKLDKLGGIGAFLYYNN